MITAEYLHEQVASLELQRTNALATYNAAGGAIEAYRHLLSILDAKAKQGDKIKSSPGDQNGDPDRVA